MSERKSQRILVVDDDTDILDLLKYNLEKEGFHVKTLSNSHKTLSVAKDFCPDLVILDIMMPHPNGIEVCKELRKQKLFADTYIFFLTAKSESYYQQAALATGGDDFIEKVIGLRALTYKVNSVLKKNFIIRKSVPEINVGSLRLNRQSNTVRYHGNTFQLSKPEFDLLFFFAQNRNRLITSENVINNIWGSEIFLFDTSIDIYIENLRKKMGLPMIQRIDKHHYKFIRND